MLKIGIVGCGDISSIYCKNLTRVFKNVELKGVCDLIPERSALRKEEYGISTIYKDMHEMFADPEISIVLNLTRPNEHFLVSMEAIKAGKHVYSEKPLGASFEEGQKLLKAATEKGVIFGGAPDTFLGAGIQTCRKLIDDGYIGTPVGASAFMVCRGHESWHPDPAFYYQYGGGPMMDMGPYYITALVNLLGNVTEVAGMAKKSFESRTITSAPKFGTTIEVETPTYITGMMQFQQGSIGTIFTTFDAYAAEVPRIEIYGTDGTLSVPDPNTFSGPVRLYRKESGKFLEMPLMFDYAENSRGLGVLDMALAIETVRKPRAGIELTYHVLEIMTAFLRSSEKRAFETIQSTVERPLPMMYAL